ncbi:MAG: ImmA/IrrE family metallo-endopeptidase [Gemmataceae bacterium]
MDDRPREEIVAALDDIVSELLDQAGVSEPPVDAIALAQSHLGIPVSLDTRQEPRGRVQRIGRRPRIYLRPEPTEERHQWTVAHEIGRHFKSQIHERLDLDPEEAKALTGDSLHTLFSSRLLVPTIWFAEDAKALDFNLLELKKRYTTSSNEVIARRMLDLPYPTIITVVDNGTVTKRKTNGPEIKATEMEPVEQRCWEYVNQNSLPRIVTEGNWTVQGWPIHQTDWKREILRTVVDE